MKTTPLSKPDATEDEMLPEYDLDYSKGIRNPYIGQLPPRSQPHVSLTTFSVSLPPDAAAFYKALGEDASAAMETVLADYAASHQNTAK